MFLSQVSPRRLSARANDSVAGSRPIEGESSWVRPTSRLILATCVVLSGFLTAPALATFEPLDTPASSWIGKKVVFARRGVVLKIGRRQVTMPYGTFHVYTVKQAQGAWLWVTSSGVNKAVIVPDAKEGIAGWVKISDVVLEDEAIDSFTRVLNANANNWFAHYMRGCLLDKRREYDKSIADYDACVRLDPNSASYNNRGWAWYGKKEYDKAIADYDKAIEIDPKDAWVYNNRGIAWSKKKEYDKAIADYDKAIEIDPKYAWAYNNRGIAWSKKKEYDKAIADYNKAIEIDPKDAWAYNNRGNAWFYKKEYDKAIANYNKAIEIDPKLTMAYNDRGWSWCVKKDYDKAIANYDKALEIDPKFVLAYNNRGVAWIGKKDYDKAIADYDKAIEIDPKDAMTFIGRGIAWSRKKQNEKAIADFNKLIELDAKESGTLNAAAWFLSTNINDDLRDGKRAEELATKACELSGWKDASDLDTLAAALAETGDFDSAVKRETEAIDHCTDRSLVSEFTARLKLFREKKPYRGD